MQQALLQQLQLVTEPNRFEMIRLLLTSKQDLCVNEIAEMINASPSSVSHHFAKLELAGVVCSYKQGRKVCYKIQNSQMTKKLKQIYEILIN